MKADTILFLLFLAIFGIMVYELIKFLGGK